MDTIQELEVIRDYGQAKEWAALVMNGEEIVPAGRPNWLRFVLLSQRSDQQVRVRVYQGGANPSNSPTSWESHQRRTPVQAGPLCRSR